MAGEFDEAMLQEDIQVKEGEALRATLQLLIEEFPTQLKGKTLMCKIDNQVLKAVIERKGTSQNLALNNIGKQIYWLQQMGQFYISLQYVKSQLNVADKFTREAAGLEVSISHFVFMKIWNKWGLLNGILWLRLLMLTKTLRGKSFFSFLDTMILELVESTFLPKIYNF